MTMSAYQNTHKLEDKQFNVIPVVKVIAEGVFGMVDELCVAEVAINVSRYINKEGFIDANGETTSDPMLLLTALTDVVTHSVNAALDHLVEPRLGREKFIYNVVFEGCCKENHDASKVAASLIKALANQTNILRNTLIFDINGADGECDMVDVSLDFQLAWLAVV